MAKQYSLKDISVITLKRITVDDDLREFIEKVNFNFDQILSVLDNRFYDEVSKNVLKLIASGKYLQYLTNKPSDSVQWIGKPGCTGKPGVGKNGKDGHSIYVSKTEIPQDGVADNFKYKEGDVVLDKSGYIYVITKKNDKLYYTLQFKLSTGSGNNNGAGNQSVSSIITTEDKYTANNDVADHWILYDADNTVYGSNNVVLATADDTFTQLYRLTIGAEKAINENNGTLNLVNIPSFRSSAADETFSPQILLKYRKNYQSALLPDVSAHIRYFDVYDSTLENVEHQQLDMWTSANTGVSVQSFAGKPKENAVIFNARKIRFLGNRDVIPTIFSKPELIVRVHEQVGNQRTKDNDYDLSSYGQSYVAVYTNENLLIDAAKEISINGKTNLTLSASNIQLSGEIDVNGTLRTDYIEHTARGNEIIIGRKLHVGDTTLLLDNNYELITNRISNRGSITITAPTVDIPNVVSIGDQLKVNNILPKSGQAVTISQIAITSNSTIAGKTIYHAGNLNLLSVPFAAQQYNATSAGYWIDGKKIMFTTNNLLTIGNSTLDNVNVISKGGLAVNGDQVITTSVYTSATQNITKELEKKADRTELILNVKNIAGVPSGILLGERGTLLDYETLGFPLVKKANHSDYVLGGDYKWLEIQPIPFLKNSSANVEKGVLGFLDKNELQYLSLEQLLDTNSYKATDNNHIQVVNVNRDGKLQITNVLQIVNPSVVGEDLILSYDKDSQAAVWKENNPLPKEGKKPGRVLVLGENNKPEWGNDHMHYRFFWNPKTNKLDRIDPSKMEFAKWWNMEGFYDERNYGTIQRKTWSSGFLYNDYVCNKGGNLLQFSIKNVSDDITGLEYKPRTGDNFMPSERYRSYYHFNRNVSGIFTEDNYKNLAIFRYMVTVLGNTVTVYFWKPRDSDISDTFEKLSNNLLLQNKSLGLPYTYMQYKGVIDAGTTMHLPNFLANYDNHGLLLGQYGINPNYTTKRIEQSPYDTRMHMILECLPFERYLYYARAALKSDETAPLNDLEFNYRNRIVTLGLDFTCPILNQKESTQRLLQEFDNYGTLNQVSWTLSAPISKEHYNFVEPEYTANDVVQSITHDNGDEELF